MSKKFASTNIRQSGPPQLDEPSWMKFGMTYYTEPFSPPPDFDKGMIAQLIDIVSEKQVEMQDHLWLLQTDPAYFYDFASYWEQHSLFAIEGAQMSKEAKAHELQGRVFAYSVAKAQDWDHLAEELSHVQREHKINCGNIKPSQPLPETYDRALGGLVLLVINRLILRATRVKELTFCSPAWKDDYKIIKQIDHKKVALMRKDEATMKSREIYKKDHIRFCLIALGERPESQGAYNIALILKSLDLYLGECQKKDAEKINAISYSLITDMAAMYRIWSALRMHRPSQSFPYTKIEEILKKRHSKTWRLWRVQTKLMEWDKDPQKPPLGNALDNFNKFKMPMGKKTQEWLDRADSGRKVLSNVWSRVRESYKTMYRSANVNAADTEEVLQMLSLQNSKRGFHRNGMRF